MGGWIRHGWIWLFWGAPIFSPEVPNTSLLLKDFGTSGLKIGAPQKRQPTTDPTLHSRPSETPRPQTIARVWVDPTGIGCDWVPRLANASDCGCLLRCTSLDVALVAGNPCGCTLRLQNLPLHCYRCLPPQHPTFLLSSVLSVLPSPSSNPQLLPEVYRCGEPSLKAVTSLNKEARLLKFHFS